MLDVFENSLPTSKMILSRHGQGTWYFIFPVFQKRNLKSHTAAPGLKPSSEVKAHFVSSPREAELVQRLEKSFDSIPALSAASGVALPSAVNSCKFPEPRTHPYKTVNYHNAS